VPELPEVETTRRGVNARVRGRTITAVNIYQPRLRWPVPAGLARELPGQVIKTVRRRGKYLLFPVAKGTLIVHLGMSGSLRVLNDAPARGPHDRVDIVFDGGRVLRLRDPRRFGCVLWTTDDPLHHPLLRHLGPEPFSAAFGADYLHATSRRRRLPVRALIMDGRVVVGVGNIYASEALFRAGIRPLRPAGRLSRKDCERLAAAIRRTLRQALRAGGTSLRDFSDSEGRPGYFRQRLMVYGRAGEPCRRCGTAIRRARQGQRSAFFCPRCQT
jgi:formamidopyrimidine-DNA glycosylase